jgi:hypothetical protein
MEGRKNTLFAISIPTVSTSRFRVQLLIFVSWKQTIVAPVAIIWFLTEALFAPSFKPLTFHQRRLQFLADINNEVLLHNHAG